MPAPIPDALDEYRVKARNTAASSENKIHDADVARRHGFRGALVPGVTVYAYATHPIVAAFGAEWLARGTATVRFVGPVFDEDEVTVLGRVTARDAGGATAAVSVSTPAGGECAVATVGMPAPPASLVDPGGYPWAPLPADRPEASRERLRPGVTLGTPEVLYDEECAEGFLAEVSDAQALYRGTGGLVHPAFYLRQANRALSGNVRVGPWIHVASEVSHLSAARRGERLATRGRVAAAYEKRGREYVELDLLVTAGAEARPAALIRHTAIWRLPPPGTAPAG